MAMRNIITPAEISKVETMLSDKAPDLSVDEWMNGNSELGHKRLPRARRDNAEME
jgi:hypothetical protein